MPVPGVDVRYLSVEEIKAQQEYFTKYWIYGGQVLSSLLAVIWVFTIFPEDSIFHDYYPSGDLALDIAKVLVPFSLAVYPAIFKYEKE